MLIIDDTRFELWTPEDEEGEFHPMVRACSREIFGENSLYFDVKHKLKSISGIGSIPDAYAITVRPREWYVIENELSRHPIYDHIVKQLTKFMNGLVNPESRQSILEALDEEVSKDKVLKARLEKMIGSTEAYRFLSNLLLKRSPKIVVIIDELNEEVKEACQSLKYHTHFVEFKTFVREDDPEVRAHLFEPIQSFEPIRPSKPPRRALKWVCKHCGKPVPAKGKCRIEHLQVAHGLSGDDLKDWKKAHYKLNPDYGKPKSEPKRP